MVVGATAGKHKLLKFGKRKPRPSCLSLASGNPDPVGKTSIISIDYSRNDICVEMEVSQEAVFLMAPWSNSKKSMSTIAHITMAPLSLADVAASAVVN
jgi:hypothetical protein